MLCQCLSVGLTVVKRRSDDTNEQLFAVTSKMLLYRSAPLQLAAAQQLQLPAGARRDASVAERIYNTTQLASAAHP